MHTLEGCQTGYLHHEARTEEHCRWLGFRSNQKQHLSQLSSWDAGNLAVMLVHRNYGDSEWSHHLLAG